MSVRYMSQRYMSVRYMSQRYMSVRYMSDERYVNSQRDNKYSMFQLQL